MVDHLRAAQDELERRARDAGGGEPFERVEAQLLAALVDVVDHARRVALPTGSRRYRADKAGPLVDAALMVEAASFSSLAGSERVADIADDGARALVALHRGVRSLLWPQVQGEALDPDSVVELRDALTAFTVWVDSQATPVGPR